jgi:selenide, water dikinase
MNMETQPQFCEPNNNDAAKLTANVKAGGCAAKISAAQLAEIVRGLPDFQKPELLTTITSFEDAAVYKISEELALVQTVDFFPPLVDDAYLFGKIAAVNALSDIYAMGATPALALSILCFPVCDYPLSVAQQIVAGGAAALLEAGAALAGGHSIQGTEPLYGLAVSGFVHPQKILTNGGAQAGDVLVLSKPIGTGSLLLAYKGGLLDEESQQILLDGLTQLNKNALGAARQFSLHAATDVTGFGLIGHVHEMSKASKLRAVIRGQHVPLLPKALECAAQGLVPAGAYANRKSYAHITHIKDGIDLALSDLLFDPQTAGGLLFALPQAQADALTAALKNCGAGGEIIGYLETGEPGQVEVRAHD